MRCSVIVSHRFSWFPSVGLYMIVGYYLQKLIVYKLSSKYNKAIVEDHGQYTSLLSYCFFPLQMFQYGYSCLMPFMA